MDVLVITRAMFAVLFWPIAVLMAFAIDIATTAMLFARHPALALIPITVTIVGIAAFVRWERGRSQANG